MEEIEYTFRVNNLTNKSNESKDLTAKNSWSFSQLYPLRKQIKNLKHNLIEM